MGMDRAIHVVVDDKDYLNLQPLAVAKLLAKVAEEEKADIVILGKQVSLLLYLDILVLFSFFFIFSSKSHLELQLTKGLHIDSYFLFIFLFLLRQLTTMLTKQVNFWRDYWIDLK